MTLLYSPQKIQQLLCPADGKRRNDEIAALFKRFGKELCQLFFIIGADGVVRPVPVGRFGYNDVSLVRHLRVAQERSLGIAYIA